MVGCCVYILSAGLMCCVNNCWWHAVLFCCICNCMDVVYVVLNSVLLTILQACYEFTICIQLWYSMNHMAWSCIIGQIHTVMQVIVK